MRYKKPRFDTFGDFRRFMVRVFVVLYLVALGGIFLKWHLEGGSWWPCVATAVVAVPCMVVGYFMGIRRAQYLFDAGRNKGTLPKTK